MLKIKDYDRFNERRYSNPWVAVFANGKHDFARKVGGYTGGYGRGEAGYLYITDPVDGGVYSYGQKDGRGRSEVGYLTIVDGAPLFLDRAEALEMTLKGDAR